MTKTLAIFLMLLPSIAQARGGPRGEDGFCLFLGGIVLLGCILTYVFSSPGRVRREGCRESFRYLTELYWYRCPYNLHIYSTLLLQRKLWACIFRLRDGCVVSSFNKQETRKKKQETIV